jgi:hypothetical protein
VSTTAIETTYRGARFRSRLEARWAAFFDLIEWRWEYEPLDLDGYIPDFVLMFREPVLAEVKPAWTTTELQALAAEKIDASGWQAGALILGASWAVRRREGSFFGREGSPFRDSPTLGAYTNGYFAWADSVWGVCEGCHALTFFTADVGRGCVEDGCTWRSGTPLNFPPTKLQSGLQDRWNQAGSTVRWKAPR